MDTIPSNRPPVDHTWGTYDGHYVKVNIPNQEVHLSYAIGEEDQVDIGFSPGICLKFWSYLGSAQKMSSNDYIDVSTQGLTSFFRVDGLSVTINKMLDQWIYQRVSLRVTNQRNATVQINGRASSASSVVALDDVQIQYQICEQPGWCDFENGKY